MAHKIKESEFCPPAAIESINGFSKQDMDQVNKYCSKYGYHPNFHKGIIEDPGRCHSVSLVKESGIIYAVNGEVRENITENIAFSSYVSTRFKSTGNGRFFTKGLSDAFGLVSLIHSGGE